MKVHHLPNGADLNGLNIQGIYYKNLRGIAIHMSNKWDSWSEIWALNGLVELGSFSKKRQVGGFYNREGIHEKKCIRIHLESKHEHFSFVNEYNI